VCACPYVYYTSECFLEKELLLLEAAEVGRKDKTVEK